MNGRARIVGDEKGQALLEMWMVARLIFSATAQCKMWA